MPCSFRMISTGLVRNARFCRLPENLQNLLIRLWITCEDDDGKREADPLILKAECYPLEKTTPEQIARGVEALAAITCPVCGNPRPFLSLYVSGGKRLLQLWRFRRHQSPNRYTPSKLASHPLAQKVPYLDPHPNAKERVIEQFPPCSCFDETCSQQVDNTLPPGLGLGSGLGDGKGTGTRGRANAADAAPEPDFGFHGERLRISKSDWEAIQEPEFEKQAQAQLCDDWMLANNKAVSTLKGGAARFRNWLKSPYRKQAVNSKAAPTNPPQRCRKCRRRDGQTCQWFDRIPLTECYGKRCIIDPATGKQTSTETEIV